MLGATCLVVALTSAAALPGAEDEDVSLVDKPELSKMEADAAKLERHVTTVVPSAATLTIARGDTVFVELDVPLSRSPAASLEARLVDYRAPKEVRLAPWAEIVEVTASGRRASAKVRYPVRVSPAAGTGSEKLSGTIEIRDGESGPALAMRAVQHVIEVKAWAPTAESIELDRRAYLYHQASATEAYRILRVLHDYLRLDRVDPPPPRSRVPEEQRLVVEKFYHHRLRADVALQHLRASADAPDDKLAEAALFAIGALSKKPSGPAARASIIDNEKNAKAIQLAEAALDDLRIDEAEGIVNRLRPSGKLEKAELARVLVLFGTIEIVRGREPDGRRELGRALCIDPGLTLPFKRGPLLALVQKTFAREKTASCSRPLVIGTVTARRVLGETGPELEVVAEFGPDPRQLVTGGDIELWGGGGARSRAEKIRASHENGAHLEARFPDTGDLQNYAGQLLVKVYVRDVSGVPIASLGEKDPAPVAVTTAPELEGLQIPWWVYVVAGGIAVVGGATALIVANQNRTLTHGIGPVSVDF